MNDDILKAIDELRKRGAIGATFADGVITSVAFASPPLEPVVADKPVPTHQRLTKEERADYARLKERYEMDEELGNA